MECIDVLIGMVKSLQARNEELAKQLGKERAEKEYWMGELIRVKKEEFWEETKEDEHCIRHRTEKNTR